MIAFNHPRRVMLRTVAAVLVAMHAVATIAAPAAEDTKGDHADWTWLHTKASAALVLEPPRLAGTTTWAIDSRRHRGPIVCMAVSPDGTRAATGGADGLVRIWNLDTGELDKALLRHRHHLFTMAWSPDGTLLATHAWSEGKLCIWDVAAGTLKHDFDEPVQMRSLRWSRDGKKLAGCSLGSGRIHLVEDLAPPRVLTEIGQPVSAIEWSADGARLAVSAFDNSVNLIDAGKNGPSTRIEGLPQETFRSAAYSPDGATLALGNPRGVHLVDATTGTSRLAITTPVADLAWSPDGDRLATVSAQGMKFWNAADGKAAGGLPAPGSMMEWNAKTGRIVVATEDRVVVWAPDGKEPERAIDAGGSAAPLFQAGKPLVTGIGTPTLTAWDAATFKKLGTLAGHGKPITAAAWSTDGTHLASGGDDGSLRIWDMKKLEQLHECPGHTGRVNALAWSTDGRRLASAGRDKTARIWSAAGAAEGVLEGHASWVESLAWSPNGKLIVTGGRDKQVMIWDADSRTEQRRVAGTGPVTALAWSAVQGTPAIACGFDDGGIRVINATTGEFIAALAGSSSRSWFRTTALCWLPGRTPMLLAGRHYLAQIWDVPAGKTVQRQIVPGGASAVFPTAGGSLMVARAEDRTVRFWDPLSGTLRGCVLDEGDSLVAVSTTGDVKFTPGTKPGLIAIVDTPTGQKTLELEEFAKAHGWKNGGKLMKLPTRN